MGDVKPVKQRHYIASPTNMKGVYMQVDRKLEMVGIEESQSSWSILVY